MTPTERATEALGRRVRALHQSQFVAPAFRQLTSQVAVHAATSHHAALILGAAWPTRELVIMGRMERRGLPSPKAMLNAMRLWQAIFLTRLEVNGRPLNLQELARALSWSSAQQANDAFKRRYGMTLRAGATVGSLDAFWSDVVTALDPSNRGWHDLILT